jgi:hypothetical protein
MTWKFQSSSRAFEQFRPLWDDMNRARGNNVLLDSGFVSPLLKHFAGTNVNLGFNENSRDSGLILLTSPGFCRWETFQPSQAPLGLFLLAELDTSGQKLHGLIKKLPGFALELSVLQQDPDYSSLPPELNGPGVERFDYIQTARIHVTGTFEDYWKARGTNLRHNLARRRRRLVERGFTGELVARRSPGEVLEAIAEYGRLESLGWKGKDGTAVHPGNPQGRFYRDAFEHFCERGEGVIYQFVANGKVVASDLCLLRGEMMVVLKTAYDEEMNEYSPALLMREDIMKQIFAENRVRVVEFYGRVMDWHKRWTEEVRTMYHVTCTRYRWVPALKRFLKRSP